MKTKTTILVIGGSLRKGSYSKVIVKEVLNLSSVSLNIITFDKLGEIPIFNQDLEVNMPDVVKELKDLIKSADAILFVTPEYNHSIPGYLKNAIDWSTRPFSDNPYSDKAAGIISISNGMLGGIRAQLALRQVGIYLNVHFLNRPEVIITNIIEKIVDGILIDSHTKEKINELINALADWSIRISK